MRQLGFSTQPNVAFSKNQKVLTDVKDIGMQNRMSNVHAAIGLQQLKKLNLIIKKKKDICRRYYDYFKNSRFIKAPKLHQNKIIPFIYYIRVASKYRNKLRSYLKKKKILTALHWSPNDKYTLFKNFKKGDLSITSKISSELITIPLYYNLKINEQLYICKKINSFFKKKL